MTAKIFWHKNGSLYEHLGDNISSGDKLYRSITIKLAAGDGVKLVIHTGTGTAVGTGSFSGFKVF